MNRPVRLRRFETSTKWEGLSVSSNYVRIIRDNLDKLFAAQPPDLDRTLPARKKGRGYLFRAFGRDCFLHGAGILLGGREAEGPEAVMLSLYALHARPEPCLVEPFRAFKDLPGSTPYAGAFGTHSEKILVPHVHRIEGAKEKVATVLGGGAAPSPTPADFSLLVYPLPKIALCYVFYRADDEFPPSATCLFSYNASVFLPTDALADVGEYTSKAILSLLPSGP